MVADLDKDLKSIRRTENTGFSNFLCIFQGLNLPLPPKPFHQPPWRCETLEIQQYVARPELKKMAQYSLSLLLHFLVTPSHTNPVSLDERVNEITAGKSKSIETKDSRLCESGLRKKCDAIVAKYTSWDGQRRWRSLRQRSCFGITSTLTSGDRKEQ